VLAHRPATPDDAAAIAALAVASIRAYASFAPEAWTPPGDEAQRELAGVLEERLAAAAWGFVAGDGGGGDALAGVAMLLPAAEANRPDPDPALMHLWQLFVAEPHWGTGLAVRLHAEAVGSAAARGFTAARLFTPAGQTRSRRFYEREGWAPMAPPFFESASASRWSSTAAQCRERSAAGGHARGTRGSPAPPAPQVELPGLLGAAVRAADRRGDGGAERVAAHARVERAIFRPAAAARIARGGRGNRLRRGRGAGASCRPRVAALGEAGELHQLLTHITLVIDICFVIRPAKAR
jgi:GNAT superfamily N-acetyltransferase